jgi:hypothetical protein
MAKGRPKNKDYIKLDIACEVVEELTGMKRCRASLFNWAQKGRRSKHGLIVKLRAVRRGHNTYTTKEWLVDFIRSIG